MEECILTGEGSYISTGVSTFPLKGLHFNWRGAFQFEGVQF